MIRPIRPTRIATQGTGLAGMVGIHFDRHSACEQRFVSNVAEQFSKGPLRGMLVCPPLLLARLLAMLAFGAFSDICQVLQSDETVGVLIMWLTACFNRLSRPLITTKRRVAERVPFFCNRFLSRA
jgi:hypothetical protein